MSVSDPIPRLCAIRSEQVHPQRPLHLRVSTCFALLIRRNKAIAVADGLAILRYTAIEFSVM